MNLIVDLESHQLSLGPTCPVRGETIIGTLAFMLHGVPQRLAYGVAIQIGINSWIAPTASPLTSCAPSRPAADGSPYTYSLSLNTAEMLAKFTDEVLSFDCSIEVKWETAPESTKFHKTQRQKLTVDADTIRNSDSDPTVLHDYIR